MAGCCSRGESARARVRSLLAAVVVLGVAGEARAVDRFWGNQFGGGFNDPVNWQGNVVAGTGDVARFGLTTNPVLAQQVYTVSFATDRANQALKIEDDFVTFDLNGRVYWTTLTNGTEIGNQPGRTGRLTVTDGTLAMAVGSTLFVGSTDATGGLTIAAGGNLIGDTIVLRSGFVTLENGGLINARQGLINAAEGRTATVNITGAGSFWSNSGIMDVSNGTVNISQGGGVQNTFGFIGNLATSGAVTVSGALSRWIQSDALNVDSGTMAVSSGGEVRSATGMIGRFNGRSGAVTVDGANSQWINPGLLTVGDDGGGTMSVTAGGLVQSGPSDIGRGDSGSGLVIVSGSNSRWAMTGALRVGAEGDGTLDIAGGGRVENGDAVVGTGTPAFLGGAGAATVSGANSRWISSGVLTVGGSNSSGTLSVSGGGRVESVQGRVGGQGFGSASVSGAGSQWVNTGQLVVGLDAAGELEITGGAEVRDDTGVIASTPLASGSKVKVSGAGSRWIHDFSLAVGGGGNGTLEIVNGGQVTSVHGSLGTNASGVGIVTVSGVGSEWLVPGQLSVSSGGKGTLLISGGGNVRSSSNNLFDSYIRAGGAVTVIGAGSRWTVGNHLFLDGVPANPARLTIGAGGFVEVAGPLGVANFSAGQAATVTLGGGELNIAALNVGTGATFNFDAGTLRFTGNMTLDDVTLDTVLGAGHALVPLQHLGVVGTALMETRLVLDGGTFSAGSLPVGSPLLFNGGTFNLTGDNLIVGSAGLFGDTLVLANRTVNVTNAATIQGGARVVLQGGSFSAGASLNNQGEVILQNALSQVRGGVLSNSGVIRGTGSVLNNVQNTAAGQIHATAGERLSFGGTVANAGAVSVIEAELHFGGAVSNAAGAMISGRDAIVRFNGGLVNAGSLVVTFGSGDISGDVNNTGTVVVSGGARATFYDDITQNGIFRVSKTGSISGSAVVLGAFSGSGGATGGGDLFLEGDLRPGNSTAAVQFGTNVALGPGAKLAVEIGGTTPGQYDQVNVAGEMALDGTLGVSLFGGFAPVHGQAFDVITATSLTGKFAAYEGMRLADLPDGKVRFFEPRYSPAALTLDYFEALPGDANFDGRISIADYLRIDRGFARGLSGWGNGDFDFSGVIDGADFFIIDSAFLAQLGPSPNPVGAPSAAVPEPSALVSMIPLTVALLARRRRRK